MELEIPPLDESWPSLGWQVVKWIEDNLTFGPGDLLGRPAKLDDEKRAFVWRMYELFPRGAVDSNGKPIEGRRRFRRCCLSLQKGSSKTELAAWIAAAELHPDGPVRFAGWNQKGWPTGRGVQSAYIPLVAYTEEQTTDLAYAAMKEILNHPGCSVTGDFDIGEERVIERRYGGRAQALAGSPDARDGARTTFQHLDESHRFTSNRLKHAAQTMTNNLVKRLIADPWALETTTAYSPGESSVAEDTAAYAQAVYEGKIADSRLYYYHRQASDGYDLDNREQRRLAVLEASGPIMATWKDIEGIVDLWQDPQADRTYWERVWLNRPVASANQAFNISALKAAAWSDYIVAPGALITLGFDGSLSEDATAVVATEVATGYQWLIGLWEKPGSRRDWEVPLDEVYAAVAGAFADYDVWRLYGDPTYFESHMATWAGHFGDDRVIKMPTQRYIQIARELRAYATAIEAGDVHVDSSSPLVRHLGNSQRNEIGVERDTGEARWLIRKDRPNSPNKIDAAYAGLLSWWARTDAIESGVLEQSREPATAFWV